MLNSSRRSLGSKNETNSSPEAITPKEKIPTSSPLENEEKLIVSSPQKEEKSIIILKRPHTVSNLIPKTPESDLSCAPQKTILRRPVSSCEISQKPTLIQQSSSVASKRPEKYEDAHVELLLQCIMTKNPKKIFIKEILTLIQQFKKTFGSRFNPNLSEELCVAFAEYFFKLYRKFHVMHSKVVQEVLLELIPLLLAEETKNFLLMEILLALLGKPYPKEKYSTMTLLLEHIDSPDPIIFENYTILFLKDGFPLMKKSLCESLNFFAEHCDVKKYY